MLVDAGGAEVDVCAAPSATVCADFGGGVEIVAGANVVETRGGGATSGAFGSIINSTSESSLSYWSSSLLSFASTVDSTVGNSLCVDGMAPVPGSVFELP